MLQIRTNGAPQDWIDRARPVKSRGRREDGGKVRGMKFSPVAALLSPVLLGLGGCAAQTGPALPLAGAYFPA